MKKRGFTLIELLVVISIVALLSSIVLASLNSARIKARDARRQADMHSIFLALNLFYNQYGCLPITNNSTCIAGYSQIDAGGWDYSSQGGGFIDFLEASGFMSSVPDDPINNMVGDGTAGQFSYRYYCYPSGVSKGLHLSYFKEGGGWGNVRKSAGISPANDATFECK